MWLFLHDIPGFPFLPPNDSSVQCPFANIQKLGSKGCEIWERSSELQSYKLPGRHGAGVRAGVLQRSTRAALQDPQVLCVYPGKLCGVRKSPWLDHRSTPDISRELLSQVCPLGSVAMGGGSLPGALPGPPPFGQTCAAGAGGGCRRAGWRWEGLRVLQLDPPLPQREQHKNARLFSSLSPVSRLFC